MSLTPFWWLWLLALILVAWLAFLQHQRKFTFRHYGTAVRLGAILLVLWSLQLVNRPDEAYRPPLWVLVDTSASFRDLLEIPPTSTPPLKELLPVELDEQLGREFPERELVFLNWFDPKRTEEPIEWRATSSLEDALLGFLRQTNLAKGGELLLVTDGQETEATRSLAEWREQISSYGISLHTLVWKPSAKVDLELRPEANIQVAFVNEKLDLPVVIRASENLPPGSTEVVLTDGKALLDKQVVEWSADRLEVPLTLSWTPSRTGDQLLQLRLTPLSNEANLQNNLAYLSVSVRSNRLKVLHIAGRTSWDVRYLRDLLGESPEMDLISFFILRDPFEDANNIPESELALIQFPVEELFLVELFKFDVVIFHNFTIKKYLRNLAFQRSFQRFLSEGKRIVVVGGDQTEGQRGYAELFLSPEQALNWDWPLQHGEHWDYAESDLLPTELAQRQAAFTWEPNNPETNLRVLRRTSFGLGRVDWVTDPHTWRWSQSAEEQTSLRYQHLMFWQTLLYQPFYEQQQVFAEFQRSRPYHVDDQIAGNLHLPTEASEVMMELVDLETGQIAEEQVLAVQQGKAPLELVNRIPGSYEMRIRCRCTDMPELRQPLVIVEEWLELHQTGWNREWLTTVSSSTGGQMIELER